MIDSRQGRVTAREDFFVVSGNRETIARRQGRMHSWSNEYKARGEAALKGRLGTGLKA